MSSSGRRSAESAEEEEETEDEVGAEDGEESAEEGEDEEESVAAAEQSGMDGEEGDDVDDVNDDDDDADADDEAVTTWEDEEDAASSGSPEDSEERRRSLEEFRRPPVTVAVSTRRIPLLAKLRNKILGRGRPQRTQSVDMRASLSSPRIALNRRRLDLDSPYDSEGSSASLGPSLSFFRPSLFPYVPPTVRFGLPKVDKIRRPPRAVLKRLRWSQNSLVPRVVRKCLRNSHFEIVPERTLWVGYWGKHYRTAAYSSILPYQKVNHFPGTFHLGRKDRLWISIRAAGEFHGWAEWDLMPRTFCLPRDLRLLKATAAREPNRPLILKPPASARGAGIRLVHKWNQVPKKTSLVVQDYVERPFLINGSKFDLRIYVYVTSFNPLRIYLYEDGLVRFASIKYSSCTTTFGNRFIHLTNTSINKLAANDLPNSTTAGTKWSLSSLWSYLSEEGYDSQHIHERITDLVIKAFACSESSVNEFIGQTTRYPFVCHELFGFDILLDEDLKPWLLEVNISPSLQSGTETDRAVKAPMARDVLNLAGVCVPHKSHLLAPTPAHPFPQRLPPEWSGEWERLDLRTKPAEAFLYPAELAKAAEAVADYKASDAVPREIRYFVLRNKSYIGGWLAFAALFSLATAATMAANLRPAYSEGSTLCAFRFMFEDALSASLPILHTPISLAILGANFATLCLTEEGASPKKRRFAQSLRVVLGIYIGSVVLVLVVLNAEAAYWPVKEDQPIRLVLATVLAIQAIGPVSICSNFFIYYIRNQEYRRVMRKTIGLSLPAEENVNNSKPIHVTYRYKKSSAPVISFHQ